MPCGISWIEWGSWLIILILRASGATDARDSYSSDMDLGPAPIFYPIAAWFKPQVGRGHQQRPQHSHYI